VRVRVVEAEPAVGPDAVIMEGASFTVVTAAREARVMKETDPLALCDEANEWANVSVPSLCECRALLAADAIKEAVVFAADVEVVSVPAHPSAMGTETVDDAVEVRTSGERVMWDRLAE
jgi:hypothetical protein